MCFSPVFLINRKYVSTYTALSQLGVNNLFVFKTKTKDENLFL